MLAPLSTAIKSHLMVSCPAPAPCLEGDIDLPNEGKLENASARAYMSSAKRAHKEGWNQQKRRPRSEQGNHGKENEPKRMGTKNMRI